ncbi:MAG: histone deacetylase family protein [Nitriliruptorales bacterium]|nr:histone deacetylase family protein [Nitriliruptorales bacterium]
MTDLLVVSDDRHARHDPPHEVNLGRRVAPVWERPARIDALRSGLGDGEMVAAEPHGDERLLAVHDQGLVTFLSEAYTSWRDSGGPEVMIPDTFPIPRLRDGGRESPSALGNVGWWCFDTATPVVAGSYEAARAAVDVALTAADRVADGAPLAYALTRPPGHHAGRDYYGGFCLFNAAAVAAQRLTEGGRVAVLDIDYHHGNGTQDIFWSSDDVLYVSLHAEPGAAYPYFTGFADETGQGAGRGWNRNLPLPRDTDDDAYLDTLDNAIDELDGRDIATLVVSLGFDTYRHDPIGGFDLSRECYGRIGRRIADTGLPTVLIQEGGYDLDSLGPNLATLIGGLTNA